MVRKFGEGEDFSLPYDQLAELYQKVQTGDPVSRIRWASLPAGEKRLAESLVKTFTGKSAKKKKKKAEKALDAYAAGDNSRKMKAMLESAQKSPDPAEREAAWQVLNGK